MITVTLHDIENTTKLSLDIKSLCRDALLDWLLDDTRFEFAERRDFQEVLTTMIQQTFPGKYSCSLEHGLILLFHFENEEDYTYWLLKNM